MSTQLQKKQLQQDLDSNLDIQEQIKDIIKAENLSNSSHSEIQNQKDDVNFQSGSQPQINPDDELSFLGNFQVEKRNGSANSQQQISKSQESQIFSDQEFLNFEGKQIALDVQEEILNFQQRNLNQNQFPLSQKIETQNYFKQQFPNQDEKKVIEQKIRQKIKQKLLQKLLAQKQVSKNFNTNNHQTKKRRGRKPKNTTGLKIQMGNNNSSHQNSSQNDNPRKIKIRKYMTIQDIQNLKRDFEMYEYEGKKFTLKELGNKYGCVRGTIRKHFRGWKEDPSMKKYIQKLIKVPASQKQKDPKTAWKLVTMNPKTMARFKIVRKILRQNPFYTQRELGIALREIQNRPNDDQNSYIKRVLQVCGFYRKKHYVVGPERNSMNKVEARWRFCERYKRYKQLNYEIFHLNIEEELLYPHMFRDFFWVHQEDPADLRMLPYAKNIVGVIAVTGANGYFDFQLKNNGFCYVDENNTEQENSLEFVKTVTEMLQKIPKTANKQKVLVSSTQKNPDLQRKRTMMLKQFCSMKGYLWDQIPQDSHQLNPIWFLLKDAKQMMKKMDLESNEGIIKSAVQVLTTNVGNDKVIKIYQDLGYYVKRGLERQIF